MSLYDVVIVGAGAAGLFCAGVAGQKGLRVLVVEHSDRVAEKIRISGGGRCNFTNRDASPAQFLSANPHFCRSALSRYTPGDFIGLMQRHDVPFHEKHKGQLFCDHSAQDLIDLLLAECAAGGVEIRTGCEVKIIEKTASTPFHDDNYCYQIYSNHGSIQARRLVVATGGLSIPKIGASDFGYRLAQQFGLRVTATRPGLVPLTFEGADWAPYAQLAGLALPVDISTGEKKLRASYLEDLLFTHRGLSGPAVLQISSHWHEGQPLRINLAPGVNLLEHLQDAKRRSRRLIGNELGQLLPTRLADSWVQQDSRWQRPINEAADKALTDLAQGVGQWTLTPSGTEGYRKAEVTLGGVDTRDLSSQTLESKQAGLYFIGEVVDVTGWLGGYNFQWAWASGHACAQALAAELRGA